MYVKYYTASSNVLCCCHSTGTLTKNAMTVVGVRTSTALYNVTGVGYAPIGTFTTSDGTQLSPEQLAPVRAILEGSLLCNDSALTNSTGADGKEDWVPSGAPTEVALVTAGVKAGLSVAGAKEAKPRIASVPFESEHKFMATVGVWGDAAAVFVSASFCWLAYHVCSIKIRA